MTSYPGYREMLDIAEELQLYRGHLDQAGMNKMNSLKGQFGVWRSEFVQALFWVNTDPQAVKQMAFEVIDADEISGKYSGGATTFLRENLTDYIDKYARRGPLWRLATSRWLPILIAITGAVALFTYFRT